MTYYHQNSVRHNNEKSSNISEISPFILIWESELWMMANVSNKKGSIESGGDLFGFLSHAGRPIIVMATPPGPNAIFESAHFRQDIESMKYTANRLFNQIGAVYIGNWHNHHRLEFDEPSPGDIRSNHIIARKNGYMKTCQIILTFEEFFNVIQDERFSEENVGDEGFRPKCNTVARKYESQAYGLYNRSITKTKLPNNLQIRFNAFYYSDAQNGEPVQCPIKVLPGNSPFRHSLRYLNDIDLGAQYTTNKNLNIAYDIYNPPSKPGIEIPDVISKQLSKISNNVLEKTQIKKEDGYLLISLPIDNTQQFLTIAYETEKPSEAKSVFIFRKEPHFPPVDYTDIILSERRHIDMASIIVIAQKILQKSSMQENTTHADNCFKEKKNNEHY